MLNTLYLSTSRLDSFGVIERNFFLDLGIIQAFEGINVVTWIITLIACFLIVIGIFILVIYRQFPQLLSFTLANLRVKNDKKTVQDEVDFDALFKSINKAGYAYDKFQDIFYSNINAWQRKYGYCKLYDEAAAPLGMIIDCEPIHFEYGGKRWLIEFWKGQYDLNTGAEIGIYTTKDDDIDIKDVFTGTFYDCASDRDSLYLDFTLKKRGKVLFRRSGKHWWLTGFKLGEFSDPSELIMELSITLKNKAMCDAFVQGLKNAGYKENEISIDKNTVSLKFNRPRTKQPITRTEETDWIIQVKNKLLCYKYQDLTSSHDNFEDKMKAIYEKAPEIYDKIANIGKAKDIFSSIKPIDDSIK